MRKDIKTKQQLIDSFTTEATTDTFQKTLGCEEGAERVSS